MKNSQSILKKIENLLKPESTILVDLHKKIDDNTNTVAKKEKSISDKKQKISNISTEINDLNAEKDILMEVFEGLKDKDLKLITNVLKLDLNVSKDFNKLINQLPLQIEIRNNDINDLEASIKADEEKLEAASDNVTTLGETLKSALENQKELSDLIKEASSGSCLRTRNEVTELLNRLEFGKDDAYAAAKLIMFPEDELMPYFKGFKFDNALDANETYVDLDNIVEALKEVDVSDTDSKEEAKDDDDFLKGLDSSIFAFDKEEDDDKNVSTKSEEESKALEEVSDKESTQDSDLEYQKKLEDETPISFEELKNLFTEDSEDKSIQDTASKDLESSEDIISFDELQNKMSDIFGSLDTENKEEKEEEKEEKSSETEVVNFDSKVLEKLGKSAKDISLIKAFDTKDINEDEVKKVAQDKDIELSSIPLMAYKNGVLNYLDNVVSLNKFGYKPSAIELQKNSAVLSLVSNDTLEKNLKTLEDYKIDIKMPTGHIAFNLLTLEAQELVRRIDLVLENNQSDLLTYDIKALSLDIDSILKRIAFCKEYNIPYTEEKNNILTFNSYVFRQDVLEELVEKEVPINKEVKKLTDELKSVVNSDLIDILDTNLNDIFNIKLSDASKFDEYTRLEQKLEGICVCKGNTYIIDGLSFSHQNTKRNLITLINNTTNETDKDILITSLFYNSTKSIEDAKNVLESLQEDLCNI